MLVIPRNYHSYESRHCVFVWTGKDEETQLVDACFFENVEKISVFKQKRISLGLRDEFKKNKCMVKHVSNV